MVYTINRIEEWVSGLILKKPYKFLITHFKLVHFILTIFMCYLFFKYVRILSFVNDINKTYSGIISANSSSTLFNIIMYLFSLLIVVSSIFLIYLLRSKKKGVKLYISTVITYFLYFVVISYSYSVIQSLEIRIVDLSVLHNLRDFLFVIGALQLFEIGFFVVRSFGIDLKKFNFKDDMAELDITDADSEEFEINFNIDTNKINRSINKQKRFLGYFYKENKGLFYIIGIVIFIIIGYFAYLFFGVYNKFYGQGKYFSSNGLSMAVTNSYVTDYDYLNRKISDSKSFVIVEVNVKARNGLRKINPSLPELVLGFNEYYYNNDYAKYFIDLGEGYNNDEIDTNFRKYILVYPINKSDRNKTMRFKYSDFANLTEMSAKNVNIFLDVRDLDKVKNTFEYNLGDEIDFSNSLLGKSKLKITDYDLAPNFVLNYNFCVNESYCYNSVENLKPSILNNYDKVLLKLKGNVELDESISTKKLSNLYDFIEMFGSFNYVKNGEEKTDFTTLKQVNSVRVKSKDTYYLELISDVQDSEIYLILKVRDYIYKYKIS